MLQLGQSPISDLVSVRSDLLLIFHISAAGREVPRNVNDVHRRDIAILKVLRIKKCFTLSCRFVKFSI